MKPGTPITPFVGKPRRRQSGFTLMEVLIAVTITAIIGLGVWQVLSGVIASRDRVDDVAGKFDGLQKAFLLLERDITQAVNRPVRNVYGDFDPALTSRGDQFDLMLTRQGWRNPLGSRRSELQRVAYEFTGEELRRRYWQMVDQGQEDTSRDQLLLQDLKRFEVQYLDDENNWVDEWPTQEALNNATDRGMQSLGLPKGLRIRLEHGRFGEIERLYVLPSFDRQALQRQVDDQNVPANGQSGETDEQGEQGEQGEPAAGGSQ
ncbi:type II secretion system minor pseudopilin GspJ [Marinobacter sp. SS21]|uniref:type II secretion system minor pseudopilin GspJ n=1 Tax=Marinobacter sp. SS21 TaxID=2979460 RepID=UPI00232EED31|nr:type II secretion system minor pseudopilin GspJ [Marinobacter sp. SS21]MDC0663383.1 type II secretion system minor pseudopilin GspJ [Marinobacter sp. SS21]